MSLFDKYSGIDAALVRAGAPGTSAPLLDALRSFWASGKLRLVMRKGRQIGWSTIVCPRVVIATALGGEFTQGRGSRGTIAIFSHRQKEADERLVNIERAFFDLGIHVRIKDDQIEVPDRPVIIQSFPATSDAIRGANLWAAWEDEMPAWRDGDGANPARDRDAAIVPAGVGHPNFRIYSGGTPLGKRDFHAQLVSLGDTDSQAVAVGPTWYWRPDLTEARCREIQPDPHLFDREFAAHPSDEVSIAIPENDVRAMVRALAPETKDLGRSSLFIDSSAGRNDSWSYCVATSALERGRRIVYVHDMGAFEGRFAEHISFDEVVAHIANRVRGLGVTHGFTDQFQGFPLQSGFARHGIGISIRPWTGPSKVEAVSTFRRLLRDSELIVEPGAQADLAITEVLSLEETFAPSGAITVRARRTGNGHADRASLLLLIARCEAEGDILSPVTHMTTATPKTWRCGAFDKGLGGGFQDWGAMQSNPAPTAQPTMPTLPFMSIKGPGGRGGDGFGF